MTNSNKFRLISSTSLTMAAAMVASPALADEPISGILPVGGEVVQGGATIGDPSGGSVTITQTTDKAVINWDAFDIGEYNSVTFDHLGADSATLNRVTSDAASTIAGSLYADGSVFLINPNGIQITSTGSVYAERGFVASTLDVSDEDFMAGQGDFVGAVGPTDEDDWGDEGEWDARVELIDEGEPGGKAGLVIHEGSITVGTGGYVGLLGGEVRSTGYIAAPAGEVTIGATNRATFDLNGGGFLQVLAPETALISDGGGVILLPPEDAEFAVRSIVNLKELDTPFISGSNGNITIGGTIDAAGGTISVDATSDGRDLGEVFIEGRLAWDATSLDIRSSGDIIVGGDISTDARSSALTLRADSLGRGTGTVFFDGGSIMSGSGDDEGDEDGFDRRVGDLGHSVDIFYNPSSYSSPTDYSGNVSGAELTSYMLVNNVYDLQNIDANLGGTYALGRDIDASETASWNMGLGFDPLGDDLNTFYGTFNGLDQEISGLTIDRSGEDFVGLFGHVGNASIHDIGVVDADVTGGSYTGGLLGYDSSGAVISNAYVTGFVSGTSNVGGLVGYANGSTISNSYTTATVSDTGSTGFTGGLVGRADDGFIDNSFATGSVSGSRYVGGLVGYLSANSIDNSYATGSVSGTRYVGGLVGKSYLATVSRAYATGLVSGEAGYSGGLMGEAYGGSISNAYWDDYSSEQGAAVGAVEGDAIITNVAAVTSDPTKSGDANYIFNHSAWEFFQVDGGEAEERASGRGSDVATYGGAGLTWRMYEGFTAPLLTAFMEEATVQGEYSTRTYTGAAQSGGAKYTLSDGADSDLIFGKAVFGGKPAVNVGRYETKIGGLYSGQLGYDLTFISGGLTINPADLTVLYKASEVSSIYGDKIYAPKGSVSVTGLVGKDTLEGITTGKASWSSDVKHLADVGDYAITGQDFKANGNYNVTSAYQAKGNATAYSITPRSLSVMYNASKASSIYGDEIGKLGGAVSTKGLLKDDKLTGTAVWATLADSTSDVGTYGITGSGVSAGSNYDVTTFQGSQNSMALTITQRDLNVLYTADETSSIYGDAPAGLSGSVEGFGLVNGDALVGTALWASAGMVTSDVGTYGVTGSGISASSNYTVSARQAKGNGIAHSITPRALSVVYTANAATGTSGQELPALSGSVESSGLVNDDALGGSALWSTPATGSSEAGAYAINGSGLTAGDNYDVTETQAAINATALTLESGYPVPWYTVTRTSRRSALADRRAAYNRDRRSRSSSRSSRSRSSRRSR